ncbi:hypothetical protein P2H89_11015 [Paraflavitalea sp. CAU 1676]|nr:hypothetical protein [Paraflavitalea sp. CAU 1676]
MRLKKFNYSLEEVRRHIVYLNGKEIRLDQLNPTNDYATALIIRGQIDFPRFRLSTAAIRKINEPLVSRLAVSLNLPEGKIRTMLKTNPENSPLTLLGAIQIISMDTKLHYNQIIIISFNIVKGQAQDRKATL